MFGNKKIPLRGAWYGLIFLASLLPAIVLSPWLSGQARDLLLERAMLKEMLYHEQLETRLDLEIERLRTVLHNKADPIAYFLKHGNIDQIKMLIDKIAEHEKMVNTTTIYDLNANIIIGAGHASHSVAEVDQSSPVFAVPMHGRAFLGSPRILPDQHLEFTMSVPIIVDAKPVAVMVSTVNINAFWRAIKDSITEHQSSVYLVDSRGSLLNDVPGSRHQQGDLLSGKKIVRTLLAGKNWNSQASFSGFEATEVFAISSLVKSLRWGIISEIPAGLISSSILTALTTLTMIVLFSHLIFALLSLFFTRRLLSPITDLANVVKQATEGDYTQQAKPSRYQEIDALTSAYNIMINEIDSRERTLKKMYQAIDHAGESIIITNHSGDIEYVNAAFCRISGYSKDEAMGQTPGFLMHSGMQAKEFYTALWQQVKSGENWDGELINRHKDGTLYPVFMSISPVVLQGEITHYIAIQQDISKQKSLEEQLRQSQKMEAIGTLVGGIAHDFNNMLAGITGNSYIAKRMIESGKPFDAVVKITNVDVLCKQAANMISQLLAFARKDIVQMEPLSMNLCVKEALKLAQVSIPESIQLVYDISAEEMLIDGDITQLQQVLINLLSNARDAVEHADDPLITLQLSRYEADDAFIRSHAESKAKVYAHLMVSDNGNGISKESLDQVFDPFFTTKAVGKGTGLGLSMVYGAVQSHTGLIEVESEAGAGAVFHVYLPLIEQANLAAVEGIAFEAVEGIAFEAVEARGETILLVDDELYVRETTAEVLESLGYKVIQAIDGMAALDVFKLHQDEIDLAMLDVVMPRLGGIPLARLLRESRPDIPVIFVTGYDKGEVLGGENTIQKSQILTKPVDFDILSHSIRKLLQ